MRKHVNIFLCKYTWSYENRVSKHFVIFLSFPCLIACLLCCLLCTFFSGGACFVVMDLCRSRCRQNYYLPPPSSLPTPNFSAFFRPYPQFSLKHKWQLFEISTPLWHRNQGQWSYWPHIQCSKTYSLTTLEEKKRRIVGKWPSLSVTYKLFTFFHLIREEEQVNVPPCGKCFSELVLAV